MQIVERVGRVFYSVSEFYRDINPATLTGAIDIIVVMQDDGDDAKKRNESLASGRSGGHKDNEENNVSSDKNTHLACSPFHVRFGKLQLLRPQDKIVSD